MRIAILDPFSGISGDMFLGALLDAGLEETFITSLPATLGIEGVGVQVTSVLRGQVACRKVDFIIPPQPHGRHLKHIRAIVEATPAPEAVKQKAMEAFTLITECEAVIHGTTVERVHLHEVGSVDAILDIVGSIWGLALLGVERVYCGTLPLGDGFVDTAHGRMAVPTAATLKLLEGLPVRPGPEGSGELVTPTGAALVRVLSAGAPPAGFTPRASGFGAGTKDFKDRANALRLILADAELTDEDASRAAGSGSTPASSPAAIERLVVLAADLDDCTGEQVAAVAELLRAAGALDVTVLQTIMKKGRPGTRIEVLADPRLADALAALLLRESSTIGVRQHLVQRLALPREHHDVVVFGQPVGLKTVRLAGGSRRAKPEFDDVVRAAAATGRTMAEINAAVLAEGQGDGLN
ncbi:MAG TPA: nickel pincer cofactor biosynthesis protein LarC [Gemmatimonadaceae bacterium]|nr:nickel pincer cofactor biosynthesis protein LarC [Gemmatimonadaceae bacterium]